MPPNLRIMSPATPTLDDENSCSLPSENVGISKSVTEVEAVSCHSSERGDETDMEHVDSTVVDDINEKETKGTGENKESVIVAPGEINSSDDIQMQNTVQTSVDETSESTSAAKAAGAEGFENDNTEIPDNAKMSEENKLQQSVQWKGLKERARTLSIDIDRFEAEDVMAFIQDDQLDLSTMADSSLPPLMSYIRSRSASVASASAALNGAPEDKGVSSDENNVGQSLAVTSTTELVQVLEQRSRGFSFEFFSFGLSEQEPVPEETASADAKQEEGNSCDVDVPPDDVMSSSQPVAPAAEHAIGESDSRNEGCLSVPVTQSQESQSCMAEANVQRPRGDSIIFDPSSFGEGGIHEQNALRQRTAEGSSVFLDDIQSGALDIMETSELEAVSTVPAETQLELPCSAPVPEALPTFCSPPNPLLSARSKLLQLSESTSAEESCATHSSSGDSSQIPVVTITNHSVVTNDAQDMEGITSSSVSVSTVTSPSLTNVNYSLELLNKGGRIGIYLPEERKLRIAKFHSKRKMRIWRKRIKYGCRKKLADSRPRIKGRFVRRTDMESKN